jgi:hypothetical protein
VSSDGWMRDGNVDNYITTSLKSDTIKNAYLKRIMQLNKTRSNILCGFTRRASKLLPCERNVNRKLKHLAAKKQPNHSWPGALITSFSTNILTEMNLKGSV